MITVRPAAPSDAQALGDLHRRTWREAYWGALPDAVALGEARGPGYWRSRVEKMATGSVARDHGLFLAESHGAPVGFAWSGPARSDREPWDGEIYMLYVLDAHQRRGAGRELIRYSAGHLVQRGFFSLGLWCVRVNERARGFYEGLRGRRAASAIQVIRGERVPVVGYLWEDDASLLAPTSGGDYSAST